MESIQIWSVLFFLGLISCVTAQGAADTSDLCESTTCLHGGTCHDSIYWWCNCPGGKTGALCEIEMPDMTNCFNTACTNNGGTCIDDGYGNISCQCPYGKTGYECETDLPVGTCDDARDNFDVILEECVNNGGTCMDDPYSGNWYCSCPYGKSGISCETIMPEMNGTCTTANYACVSGDCEDMKNHWCSCPNGRYGTHCEYEGGGGSGGWSGGRGCLYNSCGEGRNCIDDDNYEQGFRCCPAGTMGDNCDQDDTGYDACVYNSNACQNGGTCQRMSMGKYKCFCQERYYGKQCKEEIGPNELKLEVEGCNLFEMVAGESKELWDYCNGADVPLSVRAVGIQEGIEYVVQGIRMYNGDELTPLPEKKFTLVAGNGDDITDHVSSLVVQAPAVTRDGDKPVCKNDDVYLSLRITTTDPTGPISMNETEALRVMVVCDTSGVDISLTSSENTVYLSAAGYDTTSESMAPTLQQLLGTSNYSAMQFTVEFTSEFPLPGNDAKYYVVAFLTKQDVKEPFECETSADLERPVPNLTFKDDKLWTIPFKDPEDLDIDAQLKNIKLYVGSKKRCGVYNLVILIDALVTLYNERDRCNNYVVMQVDFGHCEEKPRCRVIPNPFENGQDSAITFQHQHYYIDSEPETSLFKFDTLQWREEQKGDRYSNQERIYKVMMLGYARLEVLKTEIKDNIKENPALCEGLTKEVVDSLEDGTDADDGIEPVSEMIGGYEDALAKLQDLKSGKKTPASVRSEAEIAAGGITDPNDDEKEMFRRWVSKKAYSAVANISEAKEEGGEMEYKKEERSKLCRIGEKIATLVELKKRKNADPAAESFPQARDAYNQAIKGQLGSITGSVIAMEMFYPNARFHDCVNKMFSRAMKYLVDDIDDDSWLYEKMCGAKYNSCFRKVKALCSSHKDDCSYGIEKAFTVDTDLCEMRLFNQMMKQKGRALLLHDIRQLLRDYKRGQHDEGALAGRCNGEEHIIAKPGPIQLMKMDANGTIFFGKPNVDKDVDMMCWEPVGVCTCEECPATSYGSGGYSGSGWYSGSGGYNGGYSGGGGYSGSGGYSGGYSGGGYSGGGGFSGSGGYSGSSGMNPP